MTQLKSENAGEEANIERLPSLVPGLDTILSGGFLKDGLYILHGSPGAGKTILANQILFNHAAEGRRAIYFTVLGESHSRMMLHLRPMRFFDMARIPDDVTYISAYRTLEEGGLNGLTTLIRREVAARGATLMVLDGMSAVEMRAGPGLEMKRFTHELQTLATAAGCTMILLTTGSGSPSAPENTMADGVISLHHHREGVRSERRLLIQKLRGGSFLEGEHTYRISLDGFRAFPRLEAMEGTPATQEPLRSARLKSGVASLDALVLGGGLPVSSMAAVIGPTGTGKTTLALQFLSQSTPEEPGLWFGCFEPPGRLRLKAQAMGFDLAGAEARGEVEVLWLPVGEHILDELAHRLLDAVRRRGVKRLVIDGLTAFEQATFEPERIVRFWSALANELRVLGVTTLHTLEMADLIASELRVPSKGLTALSEVVILLRYVELRSRLFRLISLFKVREGAFDPSVREFTIHDAGIVVGQPFRGVDAKIAEVEKQQIDAVAHPSTDGDEEGTPGKAGWSGAAT